MLRLVHQTLRSFVALAEHGTLSAAGADTHRSASAVSLQLAALEAQVGRQLFVRGPRGMTLAPAGVELLAYAQQLLSIEAEARRAIGCVGVYGEVTFGMPQDFAVSMLADTLEQFKSAHPGAKVKALIERNSTVAELMRSGSLDLALLIGRRRHKRALCAVMRPTLWFARPGFSWGPTSPLPLVALERPCLFRDDAVSALERARIPYEVVFATGSVEAMWAAVRAGVGVTARMKLAEMKGVESVGPQLNLPLLPHVSLSLAKTARSDTDAARVLASLVETALVNV